MHASNCVMSRSTTNRSISRVLTVEHLEQRQMHSFNHVAEFGDFNADGNVNGADLAVWRASYGSSEQLAADGSSNGLVDGTDFLIWQRNLGQTAAFDFGDAPEPYPTLLADDGPRHLAVGPTLGPDRNAEFDGQPDENAFGDVDVSEDSGFFFSPIAAGGASAVLTVDVGGGPGKIDAWIDFDGDGAFEGSERIFAATNVIKGNNKLTFNVPARATLGTTFARVRLSTAGGLSPTGPANDGEVEDVKVSVIDRFTVTTNLDVVNNLDGLTSLREAINLANATSGLETITFDASLAGSTIKLTEGELKVRSSMTINGLGADQLTISGGGASRVFNEDQTGQRIITITEMTIADGLAPSGAGGGAFFSNGANVSFNRVVMTNNNSLANDGSTIVSAFGTLQITNSAIVGNLDTGVGAIRLQDNTTTIANTTISGNGTRGISMFNATANADSLTLTNVTIANNTGAGIEVVAFASTTQLRYQNTLFANNGGQGSIDARGNGAGLPGLSIVSLGHNLLDDAPAGVAAHAAATGDLRNTNPLLGPLADNGGPTPTHALLAGSPAIDAGDSPLATDQRGFFRPVDLAAVPNAAGGNGSDIGAFEAFSSPLPGALVATGGESTSKTSIPAITSLALSTTHPAESKSEQTQLLKATSNASAVRDEALVQFLNESGGLDPIRFTIEPLEHRDTFQREDESSIGDELNAQVTADILGLEVAK